MEEIKVTSEFAEIGISLDRTHIISLIIPKGSYYYLVGYPKGNHVGQSVTVETKTIVTIEPDFYDKITNPFLFIKTTDNTLDCNIYYDLLPIK